MYRRDGGNRKRGARSVEQGEGGPEMNCMSGVARPGTKGVARAKTMRQASVSGAGGQAILSLRSGLYRCRGARAGARWPRLTKLRIVDCGMRIEKENQKNPKSAIRNDWTDAFSAQPPCFQAASLLFRGRENRESEQYSTVFMLPAGLRLC